MIWAALELSAANNLHSCRTQESFISAELTERYCRERERDGSSADAEDSPQSPLSVILTGTPALCVYGSVSSVKAWRASSVSSVLPFDLLTFPPCVMMLSGRIRSHSHEPLGQNTPPITNCTWAACQKSGVIFSYSCDIVISSQQSV